MQIGEFITAIKALADEKGFAEEIVLEAVESALAAAYRKDYGKAGQVIRVEIIPESNQMKVFRVYTVVDNDEEITNSEAQLTLDEAKKLKKTAKVEDTIELPLEVKYDFGRVAAQTAKQVIIQRLREAEREVLYKEFKEKEHKIVNGNVQRVEGSNVIVDLGKINGIMLPPDQIPAERYYTGQRLKVWVKDVEETARGPRIIVSRSDGDFIRGLFEQEVPELETGSIEIVSLAREAGSRTKIAVKSNDANLDPVGSVVGQRGTRVQAVLSELPNEKIDIILFSDDIEQMITNALSPAKIDKIKLSKKDKTAKIWVPDDQLSLAIGRSGQNIRLASKLTEWTLDIVKDDNAPKKTVEEKAEVAEEAPESNEQEVKPEEKPEEAAEPVEKIEEAEEEESKAEEPKE